MLLTCTHIFSFGYMLQKILFKVNLDQSMYQYFVKETIAIFQVNRVHSNLFTAYSNVIDALTHIYLAHL